MIGQPVEAPPPATAKGRPGTSSGQPPDQSRRRPHWRRLAVVLVPAAVAVALCAVDLSGRSIWIDESATLSIASQHGAALWAAMRRDGGNMLAYYALVHLLFSWFGDGTAVLRAPSVVAAGLSAGAVAALGARLFRPVVGLAAGLLTAVSVAYVYWGQNGRAYAFMFAFVALSYVAFAHLVTGDSRRRPGHASRLAAIGYSAALVLALYMSFVAVLVVPAQLVSLYWYRRRFGLVAACLAVAAVASVPIVLLAHARGSSQLFWVPRPNLQSESEVVQAVAGSGLPPVFHNTASSVPLLVLTVLGVLAAAAAGLRRASRQPLADGISPARWAGALVAAWLVVPTVLDFAESLVGQSVFESRYLLMSAPAVALLLAWGLFESGLAPALAWCGLAGLLVLRGAQIVPTYGVSPEDWHAATAYVLARERPGDCALFYPSDVRQAFDYYLLHSSAPRSSWPRPVLPTAPFTEVRPYVEDYATLGGAQLDAVARSCRRVWFVSSHAGVPNGTPLSRVHYSRYLALVRGLESRYVGHRLVRMSYASQIDIWLFQDRR